MISLKNNTFLKVVTVFMVIILLIIQPMEICSANLSTVSMDKGFKQNCLAARSLFSDQDNHLNSLLYSLAETFYQEKTIEFTTSDIIKQLMKENNDVSDPSVYELLNCCSLVKFGNLIIAVFNNKGNSKCKSKLNSIKIIDIENQTISELDKLSLDKKNEVRDYIENYQAEISTVNNALNTPAKPSERVNVLLDIWEKDLQNGISAEKHIIMQYVNIAHTIIRTLPFNELVDLEKSAKILLRLKNIIFETQRKISNTLEANTNIDTVTKDKILFQIKELIKIHAYLTHYHLSLYHLSHIEEMYGFYFSKTNIFEKLKIWPLLRLIFGVVADMLIAKKELNFHLSKILKFGNQIIPGLYEEKENMNDRIKYFNLNPRIEQVKGEKGNSLYKLTNKRSKFIQQLRTMILLFISIFSYYNMGSNATFEDIRIFSMLIKTVGFTWLFVFTFGRIEPYFRMVYDMIVNKFFELKCKNLIKNQSPEEQFAFENMELKDELDKTFKSLNEEINSSCPSTDMLFIIVNNNENVNEVIKKLKKNKMIRTDVPIFLVNDNGQESGQIFLNLISSFECLNISVSDFINKTKHIQNIGLKNQKPKILKPLLKKKIKDCNIGIILSNDIDLESHSKIITLPAQLKHSFERSFSNLEFTIANIYKASRTLKETNRNGIVMLDSAPGKVYLGPFNLLGSINFFGAQVSKNEMLKINYSLFETDPGTGQVTNYLEDLDELQISHLLKDQIKAGLYNLKKANIKQFYASKYNLIISFEHLAKQIKFFNSLQKIRNHFDYINNNKTLSEKYAAFNKLDIPLRLNSDVFIPIRILSQNITLAEKLKQLDGYFSKREAKYIKYLKNTHIYPFIKSNYINMTENEINEVALEIHFQYKRLFNFYKTLLNEEQLPFESIFVYETMPGEAIFLKNNADDYDSSKNINTAEKKKSGFMLFLPGIFKLILSPVNTSSEIFSSVSAFNISLMKFFSAKKIKRIILSVAVILTVLFSALNVGVNQDKNTDNFQPTKTIELKADTSLSNIFQMEKSNIVKENFQKGISQLNQQPKISEKDKIGDKSQSDIDDGFDKDSKCQTYEVQKNDSHSLIAKKFYNDQFLWPLIYMANKDTLSKNPDLLKSRTTIKIPDINDPSSITQFVSELTHFDKTDASLMVEKLSKTMNEIVEKSKSSKKYAKNKSFDTTLKVINNNIIQAVQLPPPPEKIIAETIDNVSNITDLIQPSKVDVSGKVETSISTLNNSANLNTNTNNEPQTNPFFMIPAVAASISSFYLLIYYFKNKKKTPLKKRGSDDIQLLYDGYKKDIQTLNIKEEYKDIYNFYMIIDYWFSLPYKDKIEFIKKIKTSKSLLSQELRQFFVNYFGLPDNNFDLVLLMLQKNLDENGGIPFNKRKIFTHILKVKNQNNVTSKLNELIDIYPSFIREIRLAFLKEVNVPYNDKHFNFISSIKIRESEFRQRILLLLKEKVSGTNILEIAKEFSLITLDGRINTLKNTQKPITLNKLKKLRNPIIYQNNAIVSQIIENMNYSKPTPDFKSRKRHNSTDKAA
ncbi:MAG: hypothetical protein ACD_79C00047G0001 [uncultured bacterium]|nr:MAG: hypothetical protein ACD_79C00047G0001 [uncultured bacterium]